MTIAQQFREEGIIAGRTAGLTEGRIAGLTEGRMEGIVEGEVKTLRSIVKNLIRRNAGINEIIAITGLSRSEIEEIKRENF